MSFHLTYSGSLSAGDSCNVNLDALTGKYPPLLTQNDNFVFPTSKTNDVRLLSFSHGDTVDLYCHGSLKYQATTTVVTGADTGVSRHSLTCDNGQFVSSSDQARSFITLPSTLTMQ